MISNTNTNLNKTIEQLHNLLYRQWSSFEVCEDAYLYPESYKAIDKALIDILCSDIKIVTSFLESLDFNDMVDSFIRFYLEEIEANLKTENDRKEFWRCLYNISQKYPNPNCLIWDHLFPNDLKNILNLSDSESDSDEFSNESLNEYLDTDHSDCHSQN